MILSGKNKRDQTGIREGSHACFSELNIKVFIQALIIFNEDMGPSTECTNQLMCTINLGTYAYGIFLNNLLSFYPSMNQMQMYVEIQFWGGNPNENWGQMNNWCN